MSIYSSGTFGAWKQPCRPRNGEVFSTRTCPDSPGTNSADPIYCGGYSNGISVEALRSRRVQDSYRPRTTWVYVCRDNAPTYPIFAYLRLPLTTGVVIGWFRLISSRRLRRGGTTRGRKRYTHVVMFWFGLVWFGLQTPVLVWFHLILVPESSNQTKTTEDGLVWFWFKPWFRPFKIIRPLGRKYHVRFCSK